MTSFRSAPGTALTDTDRRAGERAAHRLAALLGGVEVLHSWPRAIRLDHPSRASRQRPHLHLCLGVAELATAGLLAAPATRRLGATAAVALFLAVFPGNLNMVRLWWDKPWIMRIAAIARLPLQIPMITEALKVRRLS